MATSPAPQRNWLTRLKNLPRRWWVAFFAISLAAHVIGVGTVLVLLFGGQRGGDNVAESLKILEMWDLQNVAKRLNIWGLQNATNKNWRNGASRMWRKNLGCVDLQSVATNI